MFLGCFVLLLLGCFCCLFCLFLLFFGGCIFFLGGRWEDGWIVLFVCLFLGWLGGRFVVLLFLCCCFFKLLFPTNYKVYSILLINVVDTSCSIAHCYI